MDFFSLESNSAMARQGEHRLNIQFYRDILHKLPMLCPQLRIHMMGVLAVLIGSPGGASCMMTGRIRLEV
jgi:hypothetical protein